MLNSSSFLYQVTKKEELIQQLRQENLTLTDEKQHAFDMVFHLMKIILISTKKDVSYIYLFS